MSPIALAVIVAAVAATAGVAGLRLGQRRRPRSTPEQLGELANAGFRPLPGWVAAFVIVGALGSVFAVGVGLAAFFGDRDARQGETAQTNRSTCLATANADWRSSVGVLLMGYVAGEGQAATFVDSIVDAGPTVEKVILDGARTTEQIRDRGVELLASAVVNDARIGDTVDPLCPFVAGDPSRTPTEPDRTQVTVDDDDSVPEISTTTEPP